MGLRPTPTKTGEMPAVQAPAPRMSDEQFKVIAQALCGTGSPEQMTAEAHRARESEAALLEAAEIAFGLIGLCRALTDDEGTLGLRALSDAIQKAGRR